MAEQCSVLPCYQFDLAENKVLRKNHTPHKCLNKNLTNKKKRTVWSSRKCHEKVSDNKQNLDIGHRKSKRLLIGQTLSPDKHDFRRHIWEITRQMTNNRLGTLMAAATFLIYYSTTRWHVVCLFVFCFYRCGKRRIVWLLLLLLFLCWFELFIMSILPIGWGLFLF